ncbi:MAG: DUF3102 domain-containing protein [Actinomycetota bacterium]|nr:DUF3102 domain-containing protein [Actinomycetota bacterium]
MSIEKRTADLTTLADRVNAEHRACDEAVGAALGHAINAGELLLEAKGRIKHGEWGSWVRDNFEGSARTAQAYMKVARELPGLEGTKAQRVADLSFREALRELSSPSENGEVVEVLGSLCECQSLEELNRKADAYRDGRARAKDGCSDNGWRRVSAEDRNTRAGWFRETAIREWAYYHHRDEAKAAHWQEELDKLDRIVRAVDMPPGRERFGLERQLNYQEMHLTLVELDVVLAKKRLESAKRLAAHDAAEYRAFGQVPPKAVYEEVKEAEEVLETRRRLLAGTEPA